MVSQDEGLQSENPMILQAMKEAAKRCIRTRFRSGSPQKHWLPSALFAPESS
jgi:hypothetical protein